MFKHYNTILAIILHYRFEICIASCIDHKTVIHMNVFIIWNSFWHFVNICFFIITEIRSIKNLCKTTLSLSDIRFNILKTVSGVNLNWSISMDTSSPFPSMLYVSIGIDFAQITYRQNIRKRSDIVLNKK